MASTIATHGAKRRRSLTEGYAFRSSLDRIDDGLRSRGEKALPSCTTGIHRGRPEFLDGSRAQLHLAAATDRIRFTLHNVTGTPEHILATHNL